MINIDERLIKKLKAGDKAAQEACYISLSPIIYTALVKICRDREIANDLLHDTFIQIFDAVSKLDITANFVAWSKKIAINKALNYVKRHKFDIVDSHTQFDCVAKELTDESDKLEVLLASLPVEHRIVIWLFIIEEYSHVEISHFMNKSESYSKSIVSRCLKKLRLTLEKSHESC